MSKKLEGKSLNIEQLNIEKLKAVFPECVSSETAGGGYQVDFKKLFSLLGNYTEDEYEKYSFTWNGKNASLRLAQKPSCGTLRPCKEESVNFDKTQNIYIEGDNLEVLKLLQKSYFGKIKVIYIDPPYNTGEDFVYSDDFKDPLARYKEITGQATKSNPETAGRFHTNWLNMIYPRLRLAYNLLIDNGVIFISIGEKEIANLKKVCDEIFGEENLVNNILVRRYDKNLNKQFIEKGIKTYNVGFEYILCYKKSAFLLHPTYRTLSEERASKGYWKGFWNDADRPTMRYNILGFTPTEGQWKWKKEVALEAVENYKEYERDYKDKMTLEEYWKSTGCIKKFIRRNMTGTGKNKGVENWIEPSDQILRTSYWSDFLVSKTDPSIKGLFEHPKNVDLLVELLKASTDKEDVVLDFFSGSATTAHAIMKLNAEDGGNRKFIMVQLPELCDKKSEAFKAGYQNICEIGKERIRCAGRNINDKQVNHNNSPLDIGFKVFKLDSSNIVKWDDSLLDLGHIDKLKIRLSEQVMNLKADRSEMDLLYEIILKMGFELTDHIETISVNNKQLYSVSNNSINMLICLAQGLVPEDIEQIAEQKPNKVVISEGSFIDNSTLSNAHYIFKNYGIELSLI